MLFRYEATTLNGQKQEGTIDAPNLELAISSLQKRNLIIVSIHPAEKPKNIWEMEIPFLERIKPRDIVILSRQLSTLFEAKVPVIESFKLLAAETENPALRKVLEKIVEDIQGGISMSAAMSKHPDAFSKFYVSMVKSGEESGKLDETFSYLADYLERSYELSSKAKSALFYPAFVVFTFIVVMVLMMMFVIPKLTSIVQEMGQDIPVYTKIVIGVSNFFRDFGIFILIALVGGIVFLWRYTKTEAGQIGISRLQLSMPFLGDLYKKLYLSRISDNLATLLSSGISAVRSLEIASEVAGNKVYEKILKESAESVRGGHSISDAFSKYPEIPPLVSRMIKIGEEAGKLNFILATLARFYKREVEHTIDNLVSLIEPIMIIVLGIFVGILILSILGPIYNIASGI